MLRKSSGERRGITLVELLVVMIIMVILATVVVAFAPGFQDAQKVGRGSDQLQGWLLMARQWAKKDRVPTGLRLTVTTVGGVSAVTDIQYVQQPPTYTVPYAVPALPPGQQPIARRISLAPLTATTSLASLDTGWTASPQSAGQIAGDFLGGGTNPNQAGEDCLSFTKRMYSITSVDCGAQHRASTRQRPLPVDITSVPATTDYYFVRAARPLTGESTLKLPQDVIIDMSQSNPTSGANTTIDILFSPSGELLSPSFSSIGKVILWVQRRDETSAGATPAIHSSPSTCRTGAY